MDENRKPKKKAGAILALVLLLLPFLYMASAGPAMALCTHRKIPCDTYFFVYAPVEWVAETRGMVA
jgi:hypothetical protein